MNNKFWPLVAGVLGIAILAMGWFLGVSPKLDEMNAANAQRATVDAQNLQHEATLAALKTEFDKIDELKSELADYQVALPPGDELSTFLGELHKLEASSGVTVKSFSASDAQQYIAAAGAVTVSPLVTADNFVAITIGLTVEGTRAQVISFVNDLQYGDRLFLVNKVTLGQDTAEPTKYQGSITGFVYVLVDPSSPPPTPTPVGSLDSSTEASPSASPAP